MRNRRGEVLEKEGIVEQQLAPPVRLITSLRNSGGEKGRNGQQLGGRKGEDKRGNRVCIFSVLRERGGGGGGGDREEGVGREK